MNPINNMNFSPDELKDTGLLCPITGNKLYYFGNPQGDTEQEIYGNYNDGNYKLPFYTRRVESPYFKHYEENPSIKDVGNIRYFLPDLTNSSWEEYKCHTPVFSVNPVYLPLDMPNELVEEILEDMRKNFPCGFPYSRRVDSKTISADLVSVQPLSLPTGQSFYLDYTYKGPNK